MAGAKKEVWADKSHQKDKVQMYLSTKDNGILKLTNIKIIINLLSLN